MRRTNPGLAVVLSFCVCIFVYAVHVRSLPELLSRPQAGTPALTPPRNLPALGAAQAQQLSSPPLLQKQQPPSIQRQRLQAQPRPEQASPQNQLLPQTPLTQQGLQVQQVKGVDNGPEEQIPPARSSNTIGSPGARIRHASSQNGPQANDNPSVLGKETEWELAQAPPRLTDPEWTRFPDAKLSQNQSPPQSQPVPYPTNLRGQCEQGRYVGRASTPVPAAVPKASQRDAAAAGVVRRPGLKRRQASAANGCPVWLGQAPSRTTWQAVRTDQWLRDYWNKRSQAFGQVPGGFVSVFRREFLGDPNSQCKLDSSENCDFSACGEPALRSASVCDQESAYQVLVTIRNIRSYFQGYLAALDQAVVSAALTHSDATYTFFPDRSKQDFQGFKSAATVLNAVVGLLGPAAPVIKTVATFLKPPDAVFFLPPHLFANIQVLALSSVAPPENVMGQTAANVGTYVRDLSVQITDIFTKGYHDLLAGRNFGKTNFLDWARGGYFVGFSGFDTEPLRDLLTRQINARIINALWTELRVVILGGMPCGEKIGVGEGPEEGHYCVDGRSWFLMYLAPHDKGSDFLNSRRWGSSWKPPGMSELGKGAYTGISYQDVIFSSVYAWIAAKGNRYNPDFADNQFAQPGGSIASDGARWEGTFTIPVCDVSLAKEAGIGFADHILQPYNRDKRVRWCGAICANNWAEKRDVDWEVTKEFFNKAHVWGYSPIIHGCAMRPPWGPGKKQLPLMEKLNPTYLIGNPTDGPVANWGIFNKIMPWWY